MDFLRKVGIMTVGTTGIGSGLIATASAKRQLFKLAKLEKRTPFRKFYAQMKKTCGRTTVLAGLGLIGWEFAPEIKDGWNYAATRLNLQEKTKNWTEFQKAKTWYDQKLAKLRKELRKIKNTWKAGVDTPNLKKRHEQEVKKLKNEQEKLKEKDNLAKKKEQEIDALTQKFNEMKNASKILNPKIIKKIINKTNAQEESTKNEEL